MNDISITEKQKESREEKIYIQKRLFLAFWQSILFYLFRVFPIDQKKIVFCCIEGTTGYSCNPKYIAEEFLRRKTNGKLDYKLVWLVNDTKKEFPTEIKAVPNTLWNRAYELTTARIWIDNSRKQLEVRKRKGQLYVQTWHARLGFKPTCLDRGTSFSKIAYIVSKHDSNMVDYWLSNSDWYDKTLSTGSLYNGKIFRCGSPRCDILINGREEARKRVRKQYHIPMDAKIIMYAPTFRGGSQKVNRDLSGGDEYAPDYKKLIQALEERFQGKWYIFLRLHPQLTVRNIESRNSLQDTYYAERLVDVSKVEDMYEILAGCDAFLTDYSSAAFDAAVMKIPVFIYAVDLKKYERERGSLLWKMRELPFPLAENITELLNVIETFNLNQYVKKIEQLFRTTNLLEDGRAANMVVTYLYKLIS